MNAFPDQDILAGEGRIGNCFQAALAGVLGKELHHVPHFALLGSIHWMHCVVAWLEIEHGLWMDTRPEGFAKEGIAPMVRHIINGQTERGTSHAVVGDTASGEMLHDPHPSRAGLTFINSRFYLFPKPRTLN